MSVTRLGSDHVKDKLIEWLTNALKCELFPREGDSIANVELPPFVSVAASIFDRALSDDTHAIELVTDGGDTYAVTIKLKSREHSSTVGSRSTGT